MNRVVVAVYLMLQSYVGLSCAQAQIIATSNIDEFCKKAPVVTHRRTIVYVDQASIVKGKNEWGLTILNRLELGPRESLTILSVNPNTFEISQAFDSCNPAFTKGELDEIAAKRGVWDRWTQLDPVAQQREFLQTFDAKLRNALDRIIGESVKFEVGKRRNILGAIAFDKNRFGDRSARYRVIVYTDGSVVDPELDLSADAAKQANILNAKYPASFSGAEVSIFGVAESSDKGASLEIRDKIASAFFLSNWAHLRSFSPSLPQQRNDVVPAVTRLEGTFDGGGTQGAAKLVYSAMPAGIVSDAWVSFSVGKTLLYVPFDADIRCDGEVCKMTATCIEPVPLLSQTPYFRKGDRLLLQGKAGGLEGALGAESHELFKDGTQEVKYGFKFQKP